jgi:hypothetical protein
VLDRGAILRHIDTPYHTHSLCLLFPCEEYARLVCRGGPPPLLHGSLLESTTFYQGTDLFQPKLKEEEKKSKKDSKSKKKVRRKKASYLRPTAASQNKLPPARSLHSPTARGSSPRANKPCSTPRTPSKSALNMDPRAFYFSRSLLAAIGAHSLPHAPALAHSSPPAFAGMWRLARP